jgi:hypothetical protein
MIEMEVESIASILNQTEFEVLGNEILSKDDDELVAKIVKVFKMSLIPNSNKKFVLVDSAKEIAVELRCLPAIEVYLLIPDGYPSNIGPLFLMNTPFYEPFKNFLYEQLS